MINIIKKKVQFNFKINKFKLLNEENKKKQSNIKIIKSQTKKNI